MSVRIHIPCILCDRIFPLARAKQEIVMSTGVCIHCYQEGVNMKTTEWCLGKKSMYDSDSLECKSLCPDRSVCKLIIQGRWKP